MKPGRRDPHDLVQLQLAELSTRMRAYFGVRGSVAPTLDQIVHAYVNLANLDEPAYADYPRYIIGGSSIAALAGNFSGVSFQGGAKRTVIDFVLLAADVNGQLQIVSNSVGAGGTSVRLRNRGRAVGNNQLPIGSSTITTQTAAGVAGDVLLGGISAPAAVTQVLPLGYRLGAPVGAQREEVAVWGSAVNFAVHAQFLGREWDE